MQRFEFKYNGKYSKILLSTIHYWLNWEQGYCDVKYYIRGLTNHPNEMDFPDENGWYECLFSNLEHIRKVIYPNDVYEFCMRHEDDRHIMYAYEELNRILAEALAEEDLSLVVCPLTNKEMEYMISSNMNRNRYEMVDDSNPDSLDPNFYSHYKAGEHATRRIGESDPRERRGCRLYAIYLHDKSLAILGYFKLIFEDPICLLEDKYFPVLALFISGLIWAIIKLY
jgi:hypothetical protein